VADHDNRLNDLFGNNSKQAALTSSPGMSFNNGNSKTITGTDSLMQMIN